MSMSTVQGCGPLRNPSSTSRPSSGRKGIQTNKRESLLLIVKDGLSCIAIWASLLVTVCDSRPLPVLFRCVSISRTYPVHITATNRHITSLNRHITSLNGVIFIEPPNNLRLNFVDYSNLGVYWAQNKFYPKLTRLTHLLSFESLIYFMPQEKGLIHRVWWTLKSIVHLYFFWNNFQPLVTQLQPFLVQLVLNEDS